MLCHSVFIMLNLDIRLDLIPHFTLLKKIEQIMILSIFTFAVQFIINFFQFKKKYIGYIFVINNAIGILLILFTKEPRFWDMINIVWFQYTWLLQIGFIGIVLVIESLKRSDARIMFSAFFIFASTIVLDILISRNIIHSPFATIFGGFASIGNIVFVLSFSMVLIRNFITIRRFQKN